MRPLTVLKKASFKNILKVLFIGLRHPFMIIPTFKATKDCMKVSTRLYGHLHSKNGPANAFRHALWNYLIAKRCYDFKKNERKVLGWTKKITDWHEDVFPNSLLARKMDLHNNKVGRSIFMQNIYRPENDIVEIFKKMTDQSLKIDDSTDLNQLENQLVHIIDQL